VSKAKGFTKREKQMQAEVASAQAAEGRARQERRQRFAAQGVDIDLVDREILHMEHELTKPKKRELNKERNARRR